MERKENGTGGVFCSCSFLLQSLPGLYTPPGQLHKTLPRLQNQDGPAISGTEVGDQEVGEVDRVEILMILLLHIREGNHLGMVGNRKLGDPGSGLGPASGLDLGIWLGTEGGKESPCLDNHREVTIRGLEMEIIRGINLPGGATLMAVHHLLDTRALALDLRHEDDRMYGDIYVGCQDRMTNETKPCLGRRHTISSVFYLYNSLYLTCLWKSTSTH